MPDETVILERPRPDVARVVMNRSSVLNALTSSMVDALHETLSLLHDDSNCRVVVLTGAGRGFCAGLDLNGYGGQRTGREVHDGLAMQRHIASLVQRIRRLPQPVIAEVNGAAAGGGLALVCAADIRLASDDAAFAVSFIRVGFSGCDIGVSWLLPRLVGVGRAHELMLTGRKFDASEAYRIGLVSDIAPRGQLRSRVDATVEALLSAPPLSLELTKQGMWLSVEAPSFDLAVELENRQQVLTSLTSDQDEAMRAFLERRPPTYTTD